MKSTDVLVKATVSAAGIDYGVIGTYRTAEKALAAALHFAQFIPHKNAPHSNKPTIHLQMVDAQTMEPQSGITKIKLP